MIYSEEQMFELVFEKFDTETMQERYYIIKNWLNDNFRRCNSCGWWYDLNYTHNCILNVEEDKLLEDYIEEYLEFLEGDCTLDEEDCLLD